MPKHEYPNLATKNEYKYLNVNTEHEYLNVNAHLNIHPNLTLLHLDTQTHLSRNTEPQCSTSKDLQIFIYLIDSTKYMTFSFFFQIGKWIPPQSISQKHNAFHGSQLEKIWIFKYS